MAYFRRSQDREPRPPETVLDEKSATFIVARVSHDLEIIDVLLKSKISIADVVCMTGLLDPFTAPQSLPKLA